MSSGVMSWQSGDLRSSMSSQQLILEAGIDPWTSKKKSRTPYMMSCVAVLVLVLLATALGYIISRVVPNQVVQQVGSSSRSGVPESDTVSESDGKGEPFVFQSGANGDPQSPPPPDPSSPPPSSPPPTAPPPTAPPPAAPPPSTPPPAPPLLPPPEPLSPVMVAAPGGGPVAIPAPPPLPPVDCDKVWEPIADLPEATTEVSTAVMRVNGEPVICTMGSMSYGTYCYYPAADEWKIMEKERLCKSDHHCTVAIENKMYLLGGYTCDDRFQVFDAATGDWEELAAPPFRSFSASCVYHEGKIELCGGSSRHESRDDSTTECATYDVASDTWEEAGALLEPVNHAGYCKYKDVMYVVAGRQGQGFHSSDPGVPFCQMYDLKDYTTSRCVDIPYETSGIGACVVAGQHVWIMGGELGIEQFNKYMKPLWGVDEGHKGGVLAAVAALEIDENGAPVGEWGFRQPLPQAKHGILPVVSDGYMYVMGGGVAAGKSAVTTAHKALVTDLLQCVKVPEGLEDARAEEKALEEEEAEP